MDETRVVGAAANREDELAEASIRPKNLDEYLGQPAVREQMKIYIEAARRRSGHMAWLEAGGEKLQLERRLTLPDIKRGDYRLELTVQDPTGRTVVTRRQDLSSPRCVGKPRSRRCHSSGSIRRSCWSPRSSRDRRGPSRWRAPIRLPDA